MNAQFKRILNKKADLMNSKENNPESNFSEKMEQIDNGKLFSDTELEQVSNNKMASLKLFNFLTTGVYEKDGNRIRLTQKQRIALASTLQKVSDLTLNKANTQDQNQNQNQNQNQKQSQNVNAQNMGMGG